MCVVSAGMAAANDTNGFDLVMAIEPAGAPWLINDMGHGQQLASVWSPTYIDIRVKVPALVGGLKQAKLQATINREEKNKILKTNDVVAGVNTKRQQYICFKRNASCVSNVNHSLN